MKNSIKITALLCALIFTTSLCACGAPTNTPSENTVLTEPEIITTETIPTETNPIETNPIETIPETTEEETAPPPPLSHIEHTFADGYCTECGASEGLIYKMNDDGISAELIMAKSCKQEKIVIAESFKGYPVTRIGASTFKDHRPVKEIVIPETVTEIASGAFMSTLIEHIKIPSGVTRIEDKAFSACRFLKSIELPEGLLYIGANAFTECSVLETIELPNSITEIGEHCFELCDSLKEITIPTGVTVLQSSLLKTCLNLERIVLHKNITTIHSMALQTFSNLREVVDFPDNLEYIGPGAFTQFFPLRTEYGNCVYIGSPDNPYQILEVIKDKSLTEAEVHKDTKFIAAYAFRASRIQKLNIPDGVKLIGAQAFLQCWELTELSLPDSIHTIESEAFASCIALTAIKLPANLRSIEYQLLDGCQSLTEIVIPSSVETVGFLAFNGCKGIKSISFPISVKNINMDIGLVSTDIHYEGTKKEWETINENVWQFEGCTLHAKDGQFHG